MAGKPVAGDGFSSNLAGMSKNQLYDIMSQMKTLIEQNQQQARQILIQNPFLTRALFQAQIMLGMVQPPQAPPMSQQPQLSAQAAQPPPNIQATHQLPGQVSVQDQTSASQTQIPARKQHQNQPANPISSSSVPTANLQSQPMPSHPLQTVQQPKGHLNAQATPVSIPQSTQIPNISPLPPFHSASQSPSLLQPPLITVSGQLHQPLQSASIPQLPLQPPLPPQPRPLVMQTLPHHFHSQMGPNVGFQHSGAPQLHYSQPMFHSGTKPPASIGPSFPQAQPPLPSQSQLQSLYPGGGSHLGSEFSNQVGNTGQADRGSAWTLGQPENAMGVQLPAPPPLVPPQIGPGSQPRPPPLTPEMEKALLQQVMSLTPEQINFLPSEQRSQVLQLQQMLRQ
ncbi:cleavage stimulating factor 64 isoform X2 [Malania oleifera]|uniref:cleavage stimulating factor 64 isoform X2 n=1 Tax=Malania oleifera TaxID=397392 RepID=UPI0025ADC87F|nr:cleavage stimulating factor 64 isoform X2 [Malania oleifera]